MVDYFRATKRLKIESLKKSAGNFNKQITFLPPGISWWKNNLCGSIGPIVWGNQNVVISTDASTKGWGASMKDSHTEGEFSAREQENHIDIWELMAASFGLQAHRTHTTNTNMLPKMDNTSAVACINKIYLTKSIPMDKVTHSILEWAISKNNWIVDTHLPGQINKQLFAFCSYRPDPDCIGINSFTENCLSTLLPFSVQKIGNDRGNNFI